MCAHIAENWHCTIFKWYRVSCGLRSGWASCWRCVAGWCTSCFKFAQPTGVATVACGGHGHSVVARGRSWDRCRSGEFMTVGVLGRFRFQTLNVAVCWPPGIAYNFPLAYCTPSGTPAHIRSPIWLHLLSIPVFFRPGDVPDSAPVAVVFKSFSPTLCTAWPFCCRILASV